MSSSGSTPYHAIAFTVIAPLYPLAEFNGNFAACSYDGAEQCMCRCSLRMVLHGNVQVLELVVSEFADDILQESDTWMRAWEFFHLLELAVFRHKLPFCKRSLD